MRFFFGVALFLNLANCAGRAPPDPRDAVREYAAAATSGDATSLRASMTTDAQQKRSRHDIEVAMNTEREAFTDRANAWRATDAVISTNASVRLPDGEDVSFVWNNGAFRINNAGLLPGGAHSPREALKQLRLALARRDYAAVLRMMTPAARKTLEDKVRALIDTLARADTLSVDVADNSATTEIPGGYTVRLQRQGGIWRIDEFE